MVNCSIVFRDWRRDLILAYVGLLGCEVEFLRCTGGVNGSMVVGKNMVDSKIIEN